MPITNKHNIPERIYNAIVVDDHIVNGDISVTQLIDAPQVRTLKKNNPTETDAMDMLAMFLGTGLHTALERSEKGKYKERVLRQASGVLLELNEEKGAEYLKKIIREQLSANTEETYLREQNFTIDLGGWTISGTCDVYDKITCYLEDYKTCSSSAFMFPEFKKSWNAQMNCYAVMLRKAGLEVKGATIHAFFKDWSKMKTMTNKDYPPHPYMRIDIPLLDNEVVTKYMEGRVSLHQRSIGGENIPCTDKERWSKPPMFKIMKKGAKRSLGNFPASSIEKKDIEFAEKMATAKMQQIDHKYSPGELSLKFKGGESNRCSNYCPVNEFCPQYQAELKQLAKDAESIEG